MQPPPLIVIGAGRSGTNALRDAICRVPGFHTWPCDEINYIWRTGNREAGSDALLPEDARPEVRARILAAFRRRARKQPGHVLVEKTCANSLRPAFVDAVLPDARFVNILRDGRDVTSSAMKRWVAPLDLRYVARKALFVPKGDLAFYALRYAKSRLHRRDVVDQRLSTWGPRFDGLDELVMEDAPLEVLCANQWAACVSTSLEQLATLPPDRVLTISYEHFTANPSETLRSVTAHAGVDASRTDLEAAAQGIRSESAGAWQHRLSRDQIDRIAPIIERVQPEIDAVL